MISRRCLSRTRHRGSIFRHIFEKYLGKIFSGAAKSVLRGIFSRNISLQNISWAIFYTSDNSKQDIREMENRFFYGERKTLISLLLAIRRVVSRQLAQTRALAERNSLIYLVGLSEHMYTLYDKKRHFYEVPIGANQFRPSNPTFFQSDTTFDRGIGIGICFEFRNTQSKSFRSI